MGCDTICDLPDSLLTQILLSLPTKDSVKTSVLSTRWRNLWLSVPGLDLATSHFGSREVLVRFMDRFMDFDQGSCLHIMRYRDAFQNNYNIDQLYELISTVVDRGIQHLDISMYLRHIEVFMHQNIYNSKTLISLKLVNVVLKNPEFVVYLPCLKIMRLESVCYGKDGPLIVEKLISGSPVLEDLELIRPFHILDENVVLYLRVSSQTLKRCCLGFALNYRGRRNFKVEIDAPRLEYWRLSKSQSDKIVVKNLSSLLMIDIDTKYKLKYESPLKPEGFRNRDIFCDFLTGISSVRHMSISGYTLAMFHCYSKLGPIPSFSNLYYLQAEFSEPSLWLLLALLESCPNLKTLSLLDFYCLKEQRKIDFTNVPRCLISTLEYVEIKKRIIKDETGIIKVANYFLENSAVLKKLTLSFAPYSITKQEVESYKKLLTSTKLSPTCEVIIDGYAADDEHMSKYYFI